MYRSVVVVNVVHVFNKMIWSTHKKCDQKPNYSKLVFAYISVALLLAAVVVVPFAHFIIIIFNLWSNIPCYC